VKINTVILAMCAVILFTIGSSPMVGGLLASGDSIWIGTEYCGDVGDQVDVDIILSTETVEIDAFTMTVLFDDSMLEFVEGIAGNLDPGWTMFGANEANPGEITVAGFSLPPNEIPVGSEGVLAILVFTVTCNDCDEGDTSELILDNLRDDIIGFNSENGMFTFVCQEPEPTVTPTPDEPTPTPTPDDSTPTPTNTPTHTPTSVPPTVTPAPTDTPEPTPTDTPEPTPTPTPELECDWLGTRLELSKSAGEYSVYTKGDEFWLKCHVCVDPAHMDVPTAILLGVYGEYWFWPSWSMEFDLEFMDHERGLTTFYGLEPFVWPELWTTAHGLEFYSAILTPEMDDIIGDFGHVSFGFEGSDPTTNEMWGYINGYAKVQVEGLTNLTQEQDRKGSIFHLYHPTTEAWLNVRWRANNKYHPKGALDWEYACHDEINWHQMKEGGNGIWHIEWEQRGDTTWVRFTSPWNQSCELNFVGGAAAWREIRSGSGDARIPASAGASVTVLEMDGTIGFAQECIE
jgi:hypothetical protein